LTLIISLWLAITTKKGETYERKKDLLNTKL